MKKLLQEEIYARGARRRLKEELGERFARLRGKRSYRTFGEESEVSETMLHRYESAGGLPGVENLITLMRTERVNIHWLLSGKGAMRRKR